jgi:hypothetical protein
MAILNLASPVTTAIAKYGIETAIARAMNKMSGTKIPVSAPNNAITPKMAEPEQGAASMEYPKPTIKTLKRFEGVEGCDLRFKLDIPSLFFKVVDIVTIPRKMMIKPNIA